MRRSAIDRTRVELDPSGDPSSDRLAAKGFQRRIVALLVLFAAPAVVVLVLGSGIAVAALWTLGSIHAYAHAESHWAKAQKDAAASLRRYVQTANEDHLEAFHAHLRIPSGDRVAREALSRDEPDRKAARVGFLQGSNEPEEVDRMIDFFLFARRSPSMERAIAIWEEADRGIGRLEGLATEIEAAFRMDGPTVAQPTAARLETFLRDIDSVDRELTELEHRFSDLLSRVARDTERVAWTTVLASATLVLLLMAAWGWWSLARLRQALAERQRLENRSVTAQRLEALGRLAGGVAHDFNNLLTTVVGHLDLLRDHLVSGASDESVLEIQNAVRRGEDLTRRLQAFGRHRPPSVEPVDVCEATALAVNLARSFLPESVELVSTPGAPDAFVRGDRSLIEQAVVNLILNARDAMAAGGVVEVRCAVRDVDAEPIVVVEVSDSGIGMPPDTARRAFEPFFSDRSQGSVPDGSGQGSGLGLTTVYRVAYEAGGRIELETAQGEGTTVRLLLPRVEAKGSSDAPRVDRPEGAPIRVLVVEDEPPVRKMVVRLMERQGFETVAVESAEEALELLRDEGSAPDVLVSDVVLPGMNGIELAARVRDRWQTVGVVLVSGYAPESLPGADRLLGRERTAFISKPFDAAGLVAAVRGVTVSPAAAGSPASQSPD